MRVAVLSERHVIMNLKAYEWMTGSAMIAHGYHLVSRD
jgi:hypothetical protein